MKIFCHSCGKSTTHNVIAKEETGSEDNDPYYWRETHYLTRCAGCDSFTYAIETWGEDDFDPVTGDLYSSWKTYPESPKRHIMDKEEELPPKIRIVYKEVIGAVNAQL